MQHMDATVSLNQWSWRRDQVRFSLWRNLHAAVPTSWMKGRSGVASLELCPWELLRATIRQSLGREGGIVLFSDTILLFTFWPAAVITWCVPVVPVASSLLALVFLFVSTVKLLSALVPHVCRSVRWKISFSTTKSQCLRFTECSYKTGHSFFDKRCHEPVRCC